ncbi:MAG: hypothetical protein K9J85_11050 [Desulfobacteraceae bacterium]|nr:hypothetical protein [Desulfobacteraceae bacterium]
MSDEIKINHFLPPGQLGKWMVANPNMWQMDLLDERQFVSFMREKGMEGYHVEDIRLLWKLRLLKADLVISSRKLKTNGLLELGGDDQYRRIYADEREPLIRKDGLGNSAIRLKAPGSWIKLHFHPFRYYVMYHIDRVLKFRVAPMQMLRSEYFPKVTEFVVGQFNRWTSTSASLQTFNRWNDLAALSIAVEPWAYEKVFHKVRYFPPFIEIEEQRERVTIHFTQLRRLFEDIGQEKIEKARQNLCCNAENLDPNKRLHVMMRLMKPDEFLKLKGRIGGCMLIITMAEMLRRAAEEIFDLELPEEDEKGFGWTPPGLKKKIYGSNRLTDRDRPAANEFMRQFGLDYGVRVRCYIEGETEYGALESVFEIYGAIELINLGGNVAQKRGKGVAFRESLKNDKDKGIFSFVLIDGDRNDHARAVRKAAEDDEICGMFFFSKPDFEFGNFTKSELEEIIWAELKKKQVDDQNSQLLLSEAISGEAILGAVKKQFPELHDIGKGRQWGRLLMDHAWQNPDIRINGTKQRRQIIEIVNYIVKAVEVNYQYNRCKFKTDPKTGQQIHRER